MTHLARSLTLGVVTAGCAAAALSVPDAAHPAPDVGLLRAQGPAALDALLGRFDAMAPGGERDALERTIDRVAAQRYATVSRLYWYTDLAAAEAAAQAQHRPILALRMLGRLDEDLSCANSRLFRATLYADADVSRTLRERFVLYWSSERPVPRVTIDFGDGRKLERTTTGNSAHYLLDEHGEVLDVLPGLYAPAVFRAELAQGLALADRVRDATPAARAAAVRAYHDEAFAAGQLAFQSVAGQPYVAAVRRLPTAKETASQLAKAQRATMSKAVVEVRDLARIGFDAGAIAPTDVAQWAAVGQRLYHLAPGSVLDDRARALVTRLHNAAGVAASPAATREVVARLEQSIAADTALDELVLRQQIRRELVDNGVRDFASLNAWIYANVFHTPRSDEWLGLLPRTDFTGLPGDGVVMR